MSDDRTSVAKVWVNETAERIAIRHAISPRTVRGWLSTGKFNEDTADHLAALADYGFDPDLLNAAVVAIADGRPIGDLPEMT